MPVKASDCAALYRGVGYSAGDAGTKGRGPLIRSHPGVGLTGRVLRPPARPYVTRLASFVGLAGRLALVIHEIGA